MCQNEHNHTSYWGLLLPMVNLLHYLMLSFISRSTHTHQLTCQQWHILNDGQPDPPFGIFSQLHYGRKKRLRELTDSNYFIYTIQIGDDIETNFRTLQVHKHQKNIYKNQVLCLVFSYCHDEIKKKKKTAKQSLK